LSGGEGYEEYKSNLSINLTTSSGNNSMAININTVGLNSSQTQNSTSDNQLLINNNNNNLSSLATNVNVNNSNGSILQHQSSFASSNFATTFEESTTGKDDLINYVITWEL
jgi:hypothetical protein